MQFRVVEGINHIPAVIRQKVEHTLNISQVYCRTNTEQKITIHTY